MIRRIVGWVVLVPLCLALIVFALANRQPVVVNFNPLAPTDGTGVPEVPLFLVLFVVLLIGVLLGGMATWFAQAPHRREERILRRETERLNRDLSNMRRSPAITTSDDFAQQ